jgi:hypothetical protein
VPHFAQGIRNIRNSCILLTGVWCGGDRHGGFKYNFATFNGCQAFDFADFVNRHEAVAAAGAAKGQPEVSALGSAVAFNQRVTVKLDELAGVARE